MPAWPLAADTRIGTVWSLASTRVYSSLTAEEQGMVCCLGFGALGALGASRVCGALERSERVECAMCVKCA